MTRPNNRTQIQGTLWHMMTWRGVLFALLLALPLSVRAQTQAAAASADETEAPEAASSEAQNSAASPSASSSASSSTTGGANRISEAQLVGLPLNGRSYSQLATL